VSIGHTSVVTLSIKPREFREGDMKKYISNPEPSLIQHEEGAETIEITIVQSE